MTPTRHRWEEPLGGGSRKLWDGRAYVSIPLSHDRPRPSWPATPKQGPIGYQEALHPPPLNDWDIAFARSPDVRIAPASVHRKPRSTMGGPVQWHSQTVPGLGARTPPAPLMDGATILSDGARRGVGIEPTTAHPKPSGGKPVKKNGFPPGAATLHLEAVEITPHDAPMRLVA